jgi:nucleoside-diphosphate-sugar epimerase
MDSMKEVKILVTGGTGLVGSYLIRKLILEGYTDIHATYREGSKFDLLGTDVDKVNWKQADIQNFSAVEEAIVGIEQVYHCAAYINFNQPEILNNINALGTANIVNAALTAGVKRFIYVSSIATTSKGVSGEMINESNYFNPHEKNSPYAVSKFLAEQEVWRGFAEGLSGAIVNPGIILGGGYWSRGSLQILDIINKKVPLIPMGSTGWVDVRDVATFLVQLMNSEVSEERFILVGKNTSYLDVFASLAQYSGQSFSPILLKSWLRKIGTVLLPLMIKFSKNKNLIAPSTLQRTAQNISFNNEKSTSVFTFQYRQLEITLKEIAEAIQNSKNSQEGFGLLSF